MRQKCGRCGNCSFRVSGDRPGIRRTFLSQDRSSCVFVRLPRSVTKPYWIVTTSRTNVLSVPVIGTRRFADLDVAGRRHHRGVCNRLPRDEIRRGLDFVSDAAEEQVFLVGEGQIGAIADRGRQLVGIVEVRVETERKFHAIGDIVAVGIIRRSAAGRASGSEILIAPTRVRVAFATWRGQLGRPAGGEVSEQVGAGAIEGRAVAGGADRPRRAVGIDHLVFGDLREEGRVVDRGRIRALQAHGAADVVERSIGERSDQRDAGVDPIGGAEGICRRDLGDRIESDHHERHAGTEAVGSGEIEIGTAAQAPVGEVLGDGPGVAEFDELEVVLREIIGEIHQLRDDDRADLRAEIGRAERVRSHAHECSCACAIRPAAEGFAV